MECKPNYYLYMPMPNAYLNGEKYMHSIHYVFLFPETDITVKWAGSTYHW